jgi:hypothetical protein
MKFNTRICAEALFLPMLILTTSGTSPVVSAMQRGRGRRQGNGRLWREASRRCLTESERFTVALFKATAEGEPFRQTLTPHQVKGSK